MMMTLYFSIFKNKKNRVNMIYAVSSDSFMNSLF